MTTNKFVGTYKLDSFDIEETSGVKRSWGKDVHGLLIYTSDGHMSVSINKTVENKSDNDLDCGEMTVGILSNLS